MKIHQLNIFKHNPSFGYKWKVKAAYKKGLLPQLKKDVSGRTLTPQNATADHVIPHSKGGRTRDENLMLATKEFNNLRGDRPLSEFVTVNEFCSYLSKFFDVKLPDFDGMEYVKGLIKTLGGGR